MFLIWRSSRSRVKAEPEKLDGRSYEAADVLLGRKVQCSDLQMEGPLLFSEL